MLSIMMFDISYETMNTYTKYKELYIVYCMLHATRTSTESTW